MTSLILATVFFVGIHLFVSGTALRQQLIQRLGEKGYLGMFALFSFIGLIWMIFAYRAAPYNELWGQVTTARWLSSLLMLAAFVFIVLGILSRNPTAIGGESLLGRSESTQGIFRITRHPFLTGCAIWAATHLLYNGDLGSLIFFGGFLLLSITGPCAIDRKMATAAAEGWQGFVEKTSAFPFFAILEQRSTFEIKELLNWRLAAAIIIYIAVFKLHSFMFGVTPG